MDEPLPPPVGEPIRPTVGAPDRPTLRRDTDAGLLSGVSAGLARYLGVDVTLVRIAFVLSTVFLGGFGLVAYLAGWVLIPTSGDGVDATGTARRIERMTRGRGAAFWFGVTLVAIGALALLDTLLEPFVPRGLFRSLAPLLPPLALILIGVLLWRSSRRVDPQVTGAGTSAGFAEELREAGAEVRRDLGSAFREVGAELGALEASLESYEAAQRARREAEGVRLGRLTFGIAMLTFGGLWIADGIGATSLGFGRIGAVSLIVIACGLLLGSFVGRPRGLVWAGLALTPLVLAGVVAQGLPVAFDDLIVVGRGGAVAGDITVRPSSFAAIELRDEGLEFGAGRVTVDLTGLDVAEVAAFAARSEADVDIMLGAGELLVMLPDTITFVIDAELGIGRLEIIGSSSAGLGLERETTLFARDPSAPTLHLDISQGVGQLTVIVRSTP
jgi:phage shock protein PspC (stress-responsive transcriptional regulator)